MNSKIIAIILICLLSTSSLFVATSYSQDRQVAVDTDENIFEIDTDLGEILGLSGDYEGFLQAEIFQVSDSTFFLEIKYKPGAHLLRKRIPLTSDELFVFRANVTSKLEIISPEMLIDQEGRALFLWNSVGLSSGFYSWAVPAILSLQDARQIVGMMMLTAGGSFFIPYTVTEDIPVSMGAAYLAIHGSYYGIGQGVALAYLINGEGLEFRPGLFAGLTGSIAGQYIGFKYATANNITPGSATLMGSLNNSAIGMTLGALHLFDVVEFENPTRIVSGSLLAGSVGGLVLGKRLSEKQNYTRGDVKVIETVEGLGLLIPVTLVSYTDTDENKAYIAAAMLGYAAGFIIGDRLIENRDFNYGQGVMCALGATAGGLVGEGLYLIVASEDNMTVQGAMTVASLGAVAGFSLVFSSLEETTGVIDDPFEFHRSKISYNLGVVPDWTYSQPRVYQDLDNNPSFTPKIRLTLKF